VRRLFQRQVVWAFVEALFLLVVLQGSDCDSSGGPDWVFTFFWKGNLYSLEGRVKDGEVVPSGVSRWNKAGERWERIDPRDGPPLGLLPTGEVEVPPGTTVQYILQGQDRRFQSRPTDDLFYVLDTYDQNVIRAFSMRTGELSATIPIPAAASALATPIALHLSADGRLLWVTVSEIEPNSFGVPPAPPRLVAIDTTTQTTVRTFSLPAGSFARDPLARPDGRIVYCNTGDILAIDANTGAIAERIRPILDGTMFQQVTMTPDGAILFATQNGTQQNPARIVAIETAQHTVSTFATRVLAAGNEGTMRVSHTGARLWVITTSQEVVAYDTASGQELARVSLRDGTFPELNSLRESLDGGSVFVNDERNRVVIRLEAKTLRIMERQPVPTESQHSRLVVVPEL
jgi:outer membrane protein assembly factor BamB